MPAGDGLVFRYGDYSFDPRPLFTVNKEVIKTASNIGLGTKYSLTLQGFILPTGLNPDIDGKGGITAVLASGNALRDAFRQDFKPLVIACVNDGGSFTNVLVTGNPKVVSIDMQNASDNYTRRMDYTINLELPSITGASYEPVGMQCGLGVTKDLSGSGLLSLSEDISVEFLNEQVGGEIPSLAESLPSVFSIQRNLTAQGDAFPCEWDKNGDGLPIYTEPWERAKAYIEANLGLQPEMTGLGQLMCVSGMNIANNYRNISVNKTDGTVSASETFLAFTGNYPAIEEFEISTERSNDSPFTNITVNGTIQGLTSIDYYGSPLKGCPPTGVTKINNAFLAWSGNPAENIRGISGALLPRADSVYRTMLTKYPEVSEPAMSPPNFRLGTINPRPLSESIGYNPIGGVITYSYSYDDRPMNCYSGALTEDISFSYTQPNDIFASLTVLGRSQGPLFQLIGTSGATTRDISINALIPVSAFGCSYPSTSMPSAAVFGLYVQPFDGFDEFIANYEARLRTEFSQVFVNSHTQSWNPKIGQFTLNKSYTVGYCV